MTLSEFNEFCRSLPVATYVVQWHGAHVWKIGGKIFAVGSEEGGQTDFTFKVSEIAFEMLKDEPGLRPAPYLASRGLKWIQHFAEPGLPDALLREYIRESYSLIAKGLSGKRRTMLGIEIGGGF